MGVRELLNASIPEECTFPATIEGHYLLNVPISTSDFLILALHGYGMNARTMLDLTLMVTGRHRLVASIQAPNQFYLSDKPGDSPVGYNWGTRNHGTASIRFHHAVVRQVRQQLEQRFGIPSSRTVLLGFSQPVGYNYRFAATFPDEIAGVVGICGGVPKDWETGNYGPVSAALLHIAREEDEFFPGSVTAAYEKKLRTRAADVEYHLLPGGHRFPSKGAVIIEPWLKRIFGINEAADARPSNP
jgi:predicted esterase